MATNDYTFKSNKSAKSVVAIPTFYKSDIDDKVELSFKEKIQLFDKNRTNVTLGRELSKEACLFATELAKSMNLLPKGFKDFLTDKEVKRLLGRMPLSNVLNFYCSLSQKNEYTYISNLSDGRRALACFNLLAATNENFIQIIQLSEMGTEFEAHLQTPFSIKFLFRMLDADLRTLYYISVISSKMPDNIDSLGKQIGKALLKFKTLYEKVEQQSIIIQGPVSARTARNIAHATKDLLKAATYDVINLDPDTYGTAIRLIRQICGTLRTFGTLLDIPNFLEPSLAGFQTYLYIDYASDNKGNLYFSLNCEIAINSSKRQTMILKTDYHTKKITLMSKTDMCVNDDIYNKLTLLVKLLERYKEREYSKEFIAISAVIMLIRYIFENEEGPTVSEKEIEQLFKILYAVGLINNTDLSTTIISNISNILNDDLGIENAYNFIKENSLTRSGMSYPLLILEGLAKTEIEPDYMFNRIYSALKLKDTSLYTLSIESYHQLMTPEYFSRAIAINIKQDDIPIFDKNPCISVITNSLFNLDTFLAESDYDYSVFEAYDLGMKKVYEKYPHFKHFFRTFYNFYPIGVLAQLFNDTQLPLDIIEGNVVFDIDQLVKKLKKHQNQELKRKEEEERRKLLEEKARERELEQQRQKEEEKQRLEEKRRIEEAEKLKQLELADANKIMEELNKNAWAGFTVSQQQAAYIRYLQEGKGPLVAANLVKDEFVHRQKEEEELLAQWEQEAKEEERLKQLELEAAAEQQRLVEEARKEEEQKAYKALCDKADKQYEDMRAGRAIFPNVLLSKEEQKTAPLLNIYEVAKLFPEMTTAQKLMKKVYEAPSDVLAVDIISAELIRMNEIKASQIIDPIDKEVMSSAKALANKHCVPYDRFTKLIELGMPVEQALITPPDRLAVLTKMYKADKIVYDRKGRYVVCKGEYIVPVSYKELRELYIKHKKTKGDSNE